MSASKKPPTGGLPQVLRRDLPHPDVLRRLERLEQEGLLEQLTPELLEEVAGKELEELRRVLGGEPPAGGVGGAAEAAGRTRREP